MIRNNKPVHRIRLGQIEAAIWENSVGDSKPNGTFHSVTLGRNYRDGEEWKTAQSFGREDLLVVGKIADLAHSWIHEQAAKRLEAPAAGRLEQR